MDIERSYFSASRFFDAWVRLMELQTRRMELNDSAHWGSNVLIVSPPTDTGTRLLANANRQGRTTLLCFSERLERIAAAYARRHGVDSLDLHVARFFRLPFVDGELEAIYANCFFDFCDERDFSLILDEMWRVLRTNGSLFAVYMGIPEGILSRGWAWAFKRLDVLSRGCRPVAMAPVLPHCSFSVRKDLSVERFGFPVRYTVAEKQERPS